MRAVLSLWSVGICCTAKGNQCTAIAKGRQASLEVREASKGEADVSEQMGSRVLRPPDGAITLSGTATSQAVPGAQGQSAFLLWMKTQLWIPVCSAWMYWVNNASLGDLGKNTDSDSAGLSDHLKQLFFKNVN